MHRHRRRIAIAALVLPLMGPGVLSVAATTPLEPQSISGPSVTTEPAKPGSQTPAGGQQVDDLLRRVAELEAALASLRDDYDARLTTIERQLESLLAADTTAAAELATTAAAGALSAEERAALERELADALGPAADATAEGPGQAPPQGGQQAFQSRTRNLNDLNPEISATGDVFATFTDRTGDPEGNQFRFAEFEVAIQAPLDPYSAAKFFIVQEEGDIELEEGYIEYNALPGRLGVKVGEMRLDWGKLNRWHQHALPQSQRPLVHQAVWGDDGLRGLGAAVSWLAPSLLGDYNEIIVAVTNDDNDISFSGRGFDEPVVTLHGTSYNDLTDAAYLELGLSYATGVNNDEGDLRTHVFGLDWNFNWSPPQRALYRGFELRGELLWQRPQTAAGTVDNIGAYTYGVFKLSRRWFAGLRADWTELPEEPGESLWGLSPYFEWWQSEWARFRFQYSYGSRQFEAPEPDHRFFFQLTWALGPHKHERY